MTLTRLTPWKRFHIMTQMAVFCLILQTCGQAQEKPIVDTVPAWDLAALSRPPAVFPAEGLHAEGMRSLFFESVPYHGKPTRVFAWVGIPQVPAGQKVPGIVLIHGGGGTAFEAWVRLWVSRGYAAIAMDTCGCIPLREGEKQWKRHEFGGPPGWGGWGQMGESWQDQWTYHAVSAAVLANSLLAAQPEVDPQRIGVTGISWGGYLTGITAGVDSRLRFAAPVYGCGFTNEHGFAQNVSSIGADKAARWMKWWDPSVYLPQAAMPMLWVNGTNDFAYTMNAWQKSYRLPTGSHTLCLRLRMPHGHGGAGENPKEIQVFADSVVSGGVPLAKITSQGQDAGSAWCEFESGEIMSKAELLFTKDQGRWQDRKWEVVAAELQGNRASAPLPAETTVFFLNLTDSRDCVVSSEHVELSPEK